MATLRDMKNNSARSQLFILVSIFITMPLSLLPYHALGATPSFAHLDSGQGVTLNGKPLEVGQDLPTAGTLQTDATHPAQVTMTASQSKLLMRPGTILTIEQPLSTGEQTHTLREGAVRAIVAHQKSRFFKVKTTSATMGVRGTDFLAISNPLLGESELIVFGGTVEMQSELDKTDSKIVTQGHWGGVGGRFGKKIGELITLPANALQHFDQTTK
jgi:hypothetical protein